MNFRQFVGTLSVLAVLLSAHMASAGESGKIVGQVIDSQTGGPMPNANLVLVGTRLGATADNQGRFLLLNIPPGTYTLRASYVGFRPYLIENVRVFADLTTQVELPMTLGDLEVEEMVVRAQRPMLDKNATNSVRIVTRNQLEVMPFRGTNALYGLQPGVVDDEGQLHFRGSRSDEIGYYVEGSSARNIVTGFKALTLIDEALEEVQLQAGGFNAEYGGTNAGLILHQLRTGGDQWNFSFLSETDRFTGDHRRRLDTYSYGYHNQVLTLSGPLFDRRLRAFVAGQHRLLGSRPVYWDGFNFEDLADSGQRGGTVHWSASDMPDTVDLDLAPGTIPHTGSRAFDLNTTLQLDLSPIQLRLTGLYSDEHRELNPAPVRNLLNQERLPEEDSQVGLWSLGATHLVNPTLLYELTFSYYNQQRQTYDPLFGDDFMLYNDSLAVARANPNFAPYVTQGVAPRPYDLSGFPFYRPGTPTSATDGSDRVSFFGKEEHSYLGLAGGLTKQARHHQLKLGFDYQRWTARRFAIGMGSVRSAIANTYPNLEAVYQRYYDGQLSEDQVLDELIAAAEAAPAGEGDLDDFKTLVRNTSRADFYGYDEFGRQRDQSGLEAPRHPVLASAYFQDKIEYRDLVLNAGLRWDYFDVDSWRFVDQAAPVRDEINFTIDPASLQKTRTFHEFSPRLGLSFPVSEGTVLHLHYGRFSQMPALEDVFTGGARLAAELGGQAYVAEPSAFDVEPIRTTQYEIGFGRQFAAAAAFEVTGFYRDVKGQLQIARQNLSPDAVGAAPFNYLQNGDFATTKGLEFVLKLRRVNRLQAQLNYTLTDARGTGSEATSALAGIENQTNLPTLISPLDHSETHRGNLFLDYRFDPNDGGPWLGGLGAGLLVKFSSGHPYTLVTGSLGQRGPEEGGILASDDPRARQPLESVNSSTTPWRFETDLRFDKALRLFGVDAKAYVYVQNLFDRKNVINVYGRSGNDQDDGFLTNPALSDQLVEANGGDTYRQLYQAVNLDNRQHYWFAEGGDIYGQPRRISMGLSFGL